LNDILDTEREELLLLFRDHLLETTSKISFEKFDGKVPEQYIKNTIASCLASKFVYKEGFNFIDSLPKKDLARVAMKCISKEKEVSMLKSALVSSDMCEAEINAILQILGNGGFCTALKLKLKWHPPFLYILICMYHHNIIQSFSISAFVIAP
jgi:glutamate dehydrogenase